MSIATPKITFCYPLQYSNSRPIILTNPLPDRYIAFHAKLSNDAFQLKGNTGIIPPRQTVKVEVLVKMVEYVPQKDIPIWIHFQQISDVHTLKSKGWKEASIGQTEKQSVVMSFISKDEQQQQQQQQQQEVHTVDTVCKNHSEVSIHYGLDLYHKYALSDIYFDADALRFASKYDVIEEIDAYFCPGCLQEMASTEGGSCTTCFECPQCSTKLTVARRTITTTTTTTAYDPNDSTSSTSSATTATTTTTTTDKKYYFTCAYCRWNSLSIGIEDEKPLGLSLQIQEYEREQPAQKAYSQLIDQWRDVANAASDDNYYSTPTLLVRQPISMLGSRSATSSSPINNLGDLAPFSLQDLERKLDLSNKQLRPLSFHNDTNNVVEPPPIDAFLRHTLGNTSSNNNVHEELNYHELATVGQRMYVPCHRDPRVRSLWPHRKGLLTRRSKRIGDKLVVKPQRHAKPHSIEFELNSNAIYFVPRISIVSLPALSLNEESTLKLLLVNPMTTVTRIRFTQIDVANLAAITKIGDSSNTLSFAALKAVVSYPREVTLAPRVESADDSTESTSQPIKDNDDDEQFVVSRDANNAIITLHITPVGEQQHDNDARVMFVLRAEFEFTINRDEEPKEAASASTATDKKKNPFLYLFFDVGRLTTSQ